MALYVAVIAILNIGLGYALALVIRREREQLALTTGETFDDYESDEWED